MIHFVIAPVELAPNDFARLDAIRAEHDPQHRLVVPHVTFVFAVPLDEGAHAHVAAIAARTAPIALRFSELRAVRDRAAAGARSHVFLVPTEGYREIVALREALYEGPWRQHRREDIPFVPHVTIAAFAAHDDAVALAESLAPMTIDGSLRTIEIVALDGGALTTLVSSPLGTT